MQNLTPTPPSPAVLAVWAEISILERAPQRRTSHRKALAKVHAAFAAGVEPDRVLHYGRLLGLRDRQVRRRIAGKEVHGRISHPVPGHANHQKRSHGQVMSTLLSIVQIAVDAGWTPEDETNPLTTDQKALLEKARGMLALPRYDLQHPRMYRSIEHSEGLVRTAAVRRKFKGRRRLARARGTQKQPASVVRALTPVDLVMPDYAMRALPPLVIDADDFMTTDERNRAELDAITPVGTTAVDEPIATDVVDALAPPADFLDELITSRGPEFEKKVDAAFARRSGTWQLTLTCGHVMTRPVKRRAGVDDPAPKWAYCDGCNGRPKREAMSVERV